MSEFQEKEINQAILIAEDENQLQPLTSTLPTVCPYSILFHCGLHSLLANVFVSV